MKFIDAFDVFIFDCDSTLTTIEGIDELAALKNKKKEVALLTASAMEGTLRFEDALEKRLDLIQPHFHDLVEIGKQYIATIVPGTQQLILSLLVRGKEVYIVSGGYRLPVQMLASHLHIPEDNVHAIELQFDETMKYRGVDRSQPLTKTGGKKAILQSMSLGNKKVAFVGDSVADLEVKPLVDCFIGFGGVVFREKVKRQSDIYLDTDFFQLLELETVTY